MAKYQTGDIVDVARSRSTMRAMIVSIDHCPVSGPYYDIMSDLGGRHWAYESQLTLVESHDQRRHATAAFYKELLNA